MREYFIYGLKGIESDTFMYIGKTINPSQRLKQHKYCKTKNIKLRDWLMSVYVEMIIIEKCDEFNWEERERYWIAYYGLSNLLNIHEGGKLIEFKSKYISKISKNVYKEVKFVELENTILKSLIQIRKDQKVKHKDLLKSLGINLVTLSRYETGRRNIPFDVLSKYADYFGYEIRLLKK